MPHHGLRAETGNAVLEIAICFTCGEAYVYRSDGSRDRHRLAAGRDVTFEAIVDRLGSPRAETAPR